MIQITRLEAEHIMYALNEAKEAMKDPMADFEAVIEQLDVAHEILGACLDNMEITTLADISEIVTNARRYQVPTGPTAAAEQHSGATAERITDDELDTHS